MKRKYLLVCIDLIWVGLAPFIALLLRDDFQPRAEALAAVVEYAAINIALAAIVLPLAGLNRGFWRYTSLPDLIRLCIAVSAVLLLTLFAYFSVSRLEDIPRSLPAIQFLILIALMSGSRLAIRVWQETRQLSSKRASGAVHSQNVLLVGVNSLAELYLKAVSEFRVTEISIVGILAAGSELRGRLLRSQKVLGRPEDLPDLIRELEVHGVLLDRIVVAELPRGLTPKALEAITDIESSSTIEVLWLPEILWQAPGQGSPADKRVPAKSRSEAATQELAPPSRQIQIKRVIDIFAAAVLIIMLAPIFALVAALTALDVGTPVLFWQKRPGRFGHAFKLYKFRTMRGAHDRDHKRIPDHARSSRIGAWLRRARLDELPQLYNILIGEMSFIGPRPLLPRDMASGPSCRLLVRPGLTGWAQVKGGRLLSIEDKAALDCWYIRHMSLALDLQILLRTIAVLCLGERINWGAVLAARQALTFATESTPSLQGVAAIPESAFAPAFRAAS